MEFFARNKREEGRERVSGCRLYPVSEMRRSTQVTAPLLAAAALGMVTGCRKPEMQRCVDDQNTVVEDSRCSTGGPESSHYGFYYGGNGSFEVGGVAGGGNAAPLPGHVYATRRGGFGSSFGIGQIVLVAGIAGVVFALGSGG